MSDTQKPIDKFLVRLSKKHERVPGQWEACCPAHDDKHASLGLREGEDGRVLLYCHARCTSSQVCSALGLSLADLFPRRDDDRRQIVATYDYTSEQGELLYQVVRFKPKDFRQRKPDGDGGWTWSLNGTNRVLYRLPELVAADQVLIVEGEKDADNLYKLGFAATCNPGGAGKWSSLSSDEVLAGKSIAIIADKDNAGRDHAYDVAKRLHGRARSIRILELPGGAVKDASDWISAGGTQDELRQLIAAAPAFDPSNAPPPSRSYTGGEYLTDYGNAERLVARFGQDLRYNTGRGAWLVWDGIRWVNDESGEVIRKAKESARSLWDDAELCTDEDQKKKLQKWAAKSESSDRLGATIKLAQSEPGIPVPQTVIDADAFKLNVLNGTIDLRTGELHPHDRCGLHSKLAPVAYNPDAEFPLFWKFLNRIMDGNLGMIAYLQRIFGLALTASIGVQEMWIFWGSGANGKSVLLETIQGIMGDYAGVASDSLLVVKHNQEHPTEIADLAGRRLIVGSETEEGARLRIQLIKQMTGNATLKARFMRQDYFEFARTHKLILVSNNRPIVPESTVAVWRRLRLIPFNVVIPPEERDQDLLWKLRSEWPGILAWGVRGCIDWQRSGMDPPAEVLAATSGYQQEQDQLGEFLTVKCILSEGLRASRTELFSEYTEWAKDAGEKRPLDRTSFYDRIRRLPGIEDAMVRITDRPTRIFRGIGLSKSQEMIP